MCAVSVVSDYYINTWPSRFPSNPTPFKGDLETKEMMRKVIELLEKIDNKLGDVECHDEAKEEFLKGLSDK